MLSSFPYTNVFPHICINGFAFLSYISYITEIQISQNGGLELVYNSKIITYEILGKIFL